MYRIDIMTLFPDTVGDLMSESILGRAQERDLIRIEAHQIRDYTLNKQKQVDNYPYGGGKGAVMQADPLFQCWTHLCALAEERPRTIYLSPAGKTFTQADAKRLKEEYGRLILVCGHYEGIDERFIEACVDEEISLGDFVLTGGEIPAMAVADAVCRLVPGVLSDEVCFTDESHFNGLLEYPQYSRPENWHGRAVPEILLSGHHANIAKWRRKQALRRTRERRPDMYAALDLSSKADQKLLREIEADEKMERYPFVRIKLSRKGPRDTEYWIKLPEWNFSEVKEVSLGFGGDKAIVPDAVHWASVEWLYQHQVAVLDALLEAFFAYYLQMREELWDCFDEDERRAYLPELHHAGELKGVIVPNGVHVMDVTKNGLCCLGFDFCCPWDEEHGLGAMTLNGRVCSVGEADESFMTWVAKKTLEM